MVYSGCTKGRHSNEKPVDIVKVAAVKEIRPEKVKGFPVAYLNSEDLIFLKRRLFIVIIFNHYNHR